MQEWMPEAIRTPPNHRDRKGLPWRHGTAWKFVLHTTETGRRRNSGGSNNYHGHQSYPHFEISEAAIEQYLPLTVGAYALSGETEQWGTGNHAHAIQAEIVWDAASARSASPAIQRNIAKVLAFTREQTGLTPNLPPQGFPERVNQENWFSKQAWYEYEGICGHGNVPGNFDRWDPGPWPIEEVIRVSDEILRGIPQEEDIDKMVLIWHRHGLYLLAGGKRSASGLEGHTCDALKAAGVKVGGNPDDDHGNLFEQLPTFR